MTTALVGVLVVFLCALFALAGLVLVRRLLPMSRRKELLDDAPRIITIHVAIRTTLTILLGFSVLVVWQQFHAAEETVQREANYLGDIYWNANDFPDPQRQQIQELARSYAQVVVDEEWDMMVEQGQHSPRVDEITRELRQTNNGFEPGTSTEQALQRDVLTRINDLSNQRYLRLLANREGIPLMLWAVLIIGGLVTLGFTYLLAIEAFWLHALSVVALTGILTLISYTIYTIDSPFGKGAVLQVAQLSPITEALEFKLGPEAFEFQLKEFEEHEAEG
ncbi:MAG: hypothetical protein QOI57_3041 [Rubrobacteraceae bacterium]|jgi:hypothetical protein|nr:hypothetical protein [Rubrobacteraceae bacterium]